MKKYFVTAIGTDSGKTVVSTILAHALQADYWKPIQCGTPKDSDTVFKLLRSRHSIIYDEAYFLKSPMSPHAAAKIENTTIDLGQIKTPPTDGNDLIIEGAGGVLVPLNDQDFVIDLAAQLDAEVVLVSNHYLGSINHTLLTINELKRKNIKVKGIIFNGSENPYTEEIILKHSGYKSLLRINKEENLNEDTINKYAIKLFESWNE
ncbi:dethiobiotin synthase [Cytophagaceae bacterium ABcell3]|nr:dethiobiotin synthase [Cytophagaceae bacterium ABcell3]